MTGTLSVVLLLSLLAVAAALYVAWPLLQRTVPADAGVPPRAGTDGRHEHDERDDRDVRDDRHTRERDDRHTRERDAATTAELNRRVVMERRQQLEQELAALPKDSPERERLILEFSSSALSDLRAEPAADARASAAGPNAADASAADGIPAHRSSGHGSSSNRPWRLLAALTIAAVILIPAGAYLWRGAPELAALSLGAPPPMAAGTAGTEDDGGASEEEVRKLVTQLEERLKQTPDEVEGWVLLGRTRMALGDVDQSIEALEHAMKLDSDNAEAASIIRADLADALARKADGNLAGRPWSLIQDALKHDERNPKALAMAGAYQVSRGEFQRALTYWEPLVELMPPDAPQRAQFMRMVAQLREGRAPTAADVQEPGSAAAIASPGAAPVAAGSPESGRAAAIASGKPARLTLDVSLSPELQSSVEALAASSKAVLFIAARRVDDRGEPIGPPAAALRVPVPAQWPKSMELGEAQALNPQMAMKPGDRIRVVARVSGGGDATRRSGEPEGFSEVVVVEDGAALKLVIDRKVP